MHNWWLLPKSNCVIDNQGIILAVKLIIDKSKFPPRKDIGTLSFENKK